MCVCVCVCVYIYSFNNLTLIEVKVTISPSVERNHLTVIITKFNPNLDLFCCFVRDNSSTKRILKC